METTAVADEFGDFQTPPALTEQVCRLLRAGSVEPASVIEPTCGIGNFVMASLNAFAKAWVVGVEINPSYVEKLTTSLAMHPARLRAEVIEGNFFDFDWPILLGRLAEPVLVVGNPPWVTNSQLGTLGSQNLPQKTNFQKHVGLDALTGKSNFDISEWMLIRLLDLLRDRQATLAMLCKTAVARKALVHAWKGGIGVQAAEMRSIDTAAFFGAAVDACLLVCTLSATGRSKECRTYDQIEDKQASGQIGYRDGQLLADVAAYTRWKHLGGEEVYKWRSGVKHDCSKVMELRKEAAGYRNGLGELVDLEDDYVYPMLKSSEVANGHIDEPVRWMLVTQKMVGDETAEIEARAPKTWAYLLRNGKALDRRGSSIYRKRPRFSVFGVGEYSFAPWKVAISGFYKRLKFTVVGPSGNKPVVFDDTVYFVGCQSEQEGRYVCSLLNSETAKQFFSAFIFWDAKRPVTVDLLKRLDLLALAREVGSEETLLQFLGRRPAQRSLFTVS